MNSNVLVEMKDMLNVVQFTSVAGKKSRDKLLKELNTLDVSDMKQLVSFYSTWNRELWHMYDFVTVNEYHWIKCAVYSVYNFYTLLLSK